MDGLEIDNLCPGDKECFCSRGATQTSLSGGIPERCQALHQAPSALVMLLLSCCYVIASLQVRAAATYSSLSRQNARASHLRCIIALAMGDFQPARKAYSIRSGLRARLLHGKICSIAVSFSVHLERSSRLNAPKQQGVRVASRARIQ